MVSFYIPSASELNEREIMKVYGVGRLVAGYLDEVFPVKGNPWGEYERIKGFLSNLDLDFKEFNLAHKCLIERLEI